jgi:hypothetical protein
MSDYTGTIWPARAPEPSQADIYDHHMGVYPNPDIDVAPAVLNPRCPVMPEHPPYTPPALTMDRLYHIQMDLANGLPISRQDQQSLITEIYRLRSEAK